MRLPCVFYTYPDIQNDRLSGFRQPSERSERMPLPSSSIERCPNSIPFRSGGALPQLSLPSVHLPQIAGLQGKDKVEIRRRGPQLAALGAAEFQLGFRAISSVMSRAGDRFCHR